MIDLPRLQKTLGTSHLAWIIKRIRRRLEQGKPIQQSVRLANPTTEQRSAVVRLFGERVPLQGAMTVRTRAVDELLREGELCDEGLPAAVAALTGPIVNRAAERSRGALAWDVEFASASERAGVRAELADWLRETPTQLWVRRVCRGDPIAGGLLLERALCVIDRLPAPGIPLAELAATVAGDSHALDVDQPLAKLVLRAAAQIADIDAHDKAALRRMAWDRLGVLVDELSAPVLVVNLKGDSRTVAGRALLLHAEAGEPYRLSVRQLLREPPDFTRDRVGDTVFVCENPTVVAAAADRLGPRSAPLVCLEGQPKTAGALLLRQLAAAGIRLLYHGDFDWPGIRIGNLVMERHAALPWQFDALAYSHTTGGTVLSGVSVAASWDPQLKPVMRAAGRAVHEEQLLEGLLRDLGK